MHSCLAAQSLAFLPSDECSTRICPFEWFLNRFQLSVTQDGHTADLGHLLAVLLLLDRIDKVFVALWRIICWRFLFQLTSWQY